MLHRLHRKAEPLILGTIFVVGFPLLYTVKLIDAVEERKYRQKGLRLWLSASGDALLLSIFGQRLPPKNY